MATQRAKPAPSLLRIPESILGQVQGEADVRHIRESWTTLRFANSRTYQPQAESRESVSLRVIADGGRVGTATTADMSPEGLSALVGWAMSIAKHAPRMKAFSGLPGDPGRKTPSPPVSKEVLDRKTETKSVEFPAAMDLVEETLSESRVAGVYNEGLVTLTVANTSGLRRTATRTIAQASLLVENMAVDPHVSGWSEVASWDPHKVNLVTLAQEALERTPQSHARPLKPGRYRTLLCAPAMSELLNMSSYGGLGAFSVEEGWSFLSGAEGKRLASPAVTIYDDPLSPLGLPEALDYDGLPTRKRSVFDSGVVGGPAHDVLTAQRFGTESTANASPPEAPYGQYGPLARHLSIRPGGASFADLLRALGTGLLVTRLHYVRFMHRKKTLVTGMTRDGTYWVEGGEVRYPVTNLRFTDSILGVLKGVELVGKDVRCCADERGFFAPVTADTVTKGMTFNSATTF